jgi:hypothetical protein
VRPDGFDALPRRFRDYIAKLESEVDGLLKSRPTLTPTGLRVIDYSSDTSTWLPDGTRLEFTVQGAKRLEEIRVYATRRGIEVNCSTSGLAVLPGVSNVVEIVPRKHSED